MFRYSVFSISVLIGLLSGCKTSEKLETVEEVDLARYKGKWYEIARFPNTFEKNLKCVTAEYSLLDNGKIRVVNSGVDQNSSKFKQSKGKAWVPNPDKPGQLKVRFFWPFAGDYYIIELDPNYQYALVGSPSRDFLWILAREKSISEESIEHLKDVAKSNGFDPSRLEFIDQDCK